MVISGFLIGLKQFRVVLRKKNARSHLGQRSKLLSALLRRHLLLLCQSEEEHSLI